MTASLVMVLIAVAVVCAVWVVGRMMLDWD
jgi:hypothetical protein